MRAVGISAVLVWLSIGTGCLGPSDESQTGTLSVNLVGQAPSGAIYRLRDAIITVQGPATTVFNTEDDPNRTSLSANVVAGDYTASVQPGWRVERVEGMTTTPVTATLISDNPASFSVLSQQRTTVPLRFRVDAGEVDMTQGYDIVLEIEETPRTFTLAVTLAGTGAGAVQSNPPGISCGSDCTEAYSAGTVVVLTASAAAGSTFTGWSGACTGTGTCMVGLASSVSVTATFAQATGLLVVGNFNGQSVEVFAASASGDVVPLRVIAGAQTTLVNPRGVAVTNDEIFVVDQSANAIDVFPVTAAGNVAPVRRIAGSSTGLSTPAGPLVFGGELYVMQQTGSLLVFPLSANGNVSPSRTITGLGAAQYVAIADGEIYTTDHSSARISVFPVSSNGPVVTTRVIAGPATGLTGVSGILVHNGEIFASTLDGTAAHGTDIRVFAQTATGDVAPLRVIGGPSTLISRPDQMSIFAGEIYTASFASNSVTVHPITANGDVAPARRIFGANTGLSGPTGAFVF